MTPLPPDEPLSIGKYKILDLAGEGAMGCVYRARDTVLNRTVAIKVMNATIANDPTLRDRFLQEAQSAGSLQHPNVVTVYDFGEVDGHLFIAMEYVEGTDLESLLQSPEPLALQRKLEIIIDVLTGLAYAHTRGIVHRDLKPANIRVTPEPRAKLMDFGVAHLDSHKMTQTGIMIGTPNYMAPEYINGQPVSAASDIFSMGAVLYEVLTGRKPFTGDTLHALLFSVIQETPVPPSTLVPGLPRSLDAVIAKALEKRPADRYATAIDMANALTAVRASLSGAAYGYTQALSTTLAMRLGTASQPMSRQSAGQTGSDASLPPAPQPAATRGAVSTAGTPRSLIIAATIVGSAVIGAAVLWRGGAEPAARLASAPATERPSPSTEGSAPSAAQGMSTPSPNEPPRAPKQLPGNSRSLATQSPTRSSTASPATAAPPAVSSARVPPPTGALAAGAPAPGTSSTPSMASPAPAPSSMVGTPVNVSPAPSSPPSSPPSSSVAPPASATTPSTATPASAPSTAADSRAVQSALRDVLARYERALSSHDLAAARALNAGLTRDQLRGFEQFFSRASDFSARLALTTSEIRERSADGVVAAVYDYTMDGRKQRQSFTLRATFENVGGEWRLQSLK